MIEEINVSNYTYKKYFIILFCLCISYHLYAQQHWSVNLSNPEVVADPLKKSTGISMPHFKWFPDGHISVVKNQNGIGHTIYWSEWENFRTLANNQFINSVFGLSPQMPILNTRKKINSFNQGGSWLMSVFRLQADTLLGFVHCEDHYYPLLNPEMKSYSSIGITYSFNDGFTWEPVQQIITSCKPKSVIPEWGGVGNNCAIYDTITNKWLVYYSNDSLCLAVSSDRFGRPGTWKKYGNGFLNNDGLGGRDIPLENLKCVPGGNSSVLYNYYFKKYMLTWHGWDGKIYCSVSADGFVWELPRLLVDSYNRSWYPFFIGNTDVYGGQNLKLYFANIYDIQSGEREMITQDVEIKVDTLRDQQFSSIFKIANVQTDNQIKDCIAYFGDSLCLLGAKMPLPTNESDNLFVAYREVEGDFVFSSKVTHVEYDSNSHFAGIFIRKNLDPASMSLSIGLTADPKQKIIFRPQDGAIALTSKKVININGLYLKISRKSNLFTISESTNGKSWSTGVSFNIKDIERRLLIGLFVNSGAQVYSGVSAFENIRFNTSEISDVSTSKANDDICVVFCNNELHILTEKFDKKSIRIFDLSGKKVSEQFFYDQKVTINLKYMLEKGVFIIQVSDSQKSTYRKVSII